MKHLRIPPIAEREQLMQRSTEELVDLILRQQEIIEQLCLNNRSRVVLRQTYGLRNFEHLRSRLLAANH